MTQQPEALRLADYLEGCDLPEAAAELRRLYTMNKKLIETLEEIRLNSPDPTDRSFARYVLKGVEE